MDTDTAAPAPPATPAATPRQPELRTLTIDRQTVRVGIWAGDHGRPPLLIFNGIGSRLELLAPFVAELDATRRVIVFDIPGTGKSPPPPMPYRLWMMACFSRRLLDRLGVGEVDVMGVSWGGTLAQQFALQEPRRTRRLVLAATGAGGIMVPGRPATLWRMLTARRFQDPAWMRQNFARLYGGAAQSAATVQTFGALMRPPSRSGYLFQQLALAGWTSLPFLPFLRARTLILAGTDDPIVPVANARILDFCIPDSRLVTYDDGHLFLFSKRAECAAEVDAFLDQPDAVARSRAA